MAFLINDEYEYVWGIIASSSLLHAITNHTCPMTESSSSFFSRKRRRPNAWKDLPAFLDASATVSVGLFGSRRLPELNDLYGAHHQKRTKKNLTTTTTSSSSDVFQSGGAKTSSRHLRRRTTAVEKRKYKHRFPKANNQKPSQSSITDDVTRKARRGKQTTLCQGHFEWQQQQQQLLLTEQENSSSSSTRIHWMVTHLWHAKRFHMESLWGWRVPLCHSNRGARAALRLQDEGRCSIQDVTWKRQSATISSTLPLSTLLPILSRMCPEFAISKATLGGSQMGSGILHQIDQFPLQAFGPARWQVSSFQNDNDVSLRWVVQWMVHPSIFQNLTDCLQFLMTERDDISIQWEKYLHSSSSCFQLCGSSATRIIQNVLRPTTRTCRQNPNDWDWAQLPEQQDAANSLPHGSIVRVNIALDANSSSSSTIIESTKDPEKTTLPKFQQHVDDVHKSIQRNNLENDKMATVRASKNQVLLVWRAPRTLDCPTNYAVSGWEIYCSCPELAKAIWMKLVLAGPCCAIGMAEESHLKLECSPPLLVFPRDYVDTQQGQLYWASTNSSWNLVRRIWEGGWGRLPIQCHSLKLPNVRWRSLVSSEKNEDRVMEEDDDPQQETRDPQVVVVRGTFAQPFVDALNGCGQLITTSCAITQPNRTRSRKHRRARRSNDVVQPPPLSRNQAEIWNQSCNILGSSLSLPAVLVCQVLVSGRGTIASGATVELSSILLGFVTVGSFSLKRGSCHGIAVVGAARLLQALTTIEGSLGRVVRLPNGSCEIQLAVTVGSGEVKCKGTMSIISQ
jgi:hypothetical protein